MHQTLKVKDLDIIYLSYDEPNAEKNYEDLLTKVPWAKRVHGVEGSDAAHKACAKLSNTDRFITIDGDNIINPKFLQEEIYFYDGADIDKAVISWTAKNSINNLMYGNGGIKCWPKSHVLNMQTHENAEPDNVKAQVDFCWDMEYIQQDTCYSMIMNNYTPHQAWRAGFREGVKMALNEGTQLSKDGLLSQHWKNLNRLYIWTMVGCDTINGDWGILGARAGLYMAMCTDWDFIQVRDFEHLNDLWKQSFESIENVEDEIVEYGIKLINALDLPIAENPLSAQQSKFFKTVYRNPPRLISPKVVKASPVAKTEYDIVMITYNEEYMNQNYKRLLERFPYAKRIHGVDGIHNAHIKAAELCTTDMIWIVDGDAVIDDDFNFNYAVPKWDLDTVHVCNSKNPINDLIYGYGAIKLFPRELTLNMDKSKPDMTTSISNKFKKVYEISNITEFNTSPLNTWKSAFRECCKLSSKVIDRQKDDETNERLNIWCTVGNDRQYGEYAIDGANEGRKYGEYYRDSLQDLRRINDFMWLEERFNEHYK
jgi:hypothetical protein